MGNIGITLSLSDPAGVNILKALREEGFEEFGSESILRRGSIYLFVVDPLIVPEEKYKVPSEPKPYPADFDALAKRYNIAFYIVASRHWSESGKPCLTVHSTGNFGKAMYGGRDRELQKTVANPMRNVFLELTEDPPKGYEVSLEATHHSPTEFETPMFFAELGSSKRQWEDEEAAIYLAKSILKGVEAKGRATVAIGFGGGHYCPTFTVMERDIAFGHIAAKYAIDLLTEDLIKQMAYKTVDGVDVAVIDEGLKGFQRKKVEVTLKKLGIIIRN
ncbi:MAG: D-aminoacyl-tRNA deacylase [Candidatus Bathyarchaeia archaeon]